MFDPSAFSAQRQGPVILDRIQDDAGHDLAPPHHRRHDTEERQVGREILGPVDGIDDEHEVGLVEAPEQRRVALRRFLPHHDGARKGLQESRRYGGFSGLVGIGDEILSGGLFARPHGHRAAKSRQDLGPDGLPQDLDDGAGFGKAEGRQGPAPFEVR